MKKITIHQLLLCIMLFFIGNSVFAQQQVDFTLKYNTTTSEYEVYGKPQQSGPFSVGGGSQLTVMLPASYANVAISSVTSVLGGPWADNTQLYAPSASPANDFHSITTNGTAPIISFTAGQEHLIYKFTLTGGCVDGVRLYRNAAEGTAPRDPDSNGAGMQGSDFENYFAPVSTGNQEYRANYANTGVSCFTASPNIVTTIGQPTTPLVAGSPSNIPVTLTNTGTAPATGPITTTITLPTGTSAPVSFSTNNNSTCTTSSQIVTCSTPGPISNTAPTNTVILNIPVTPAASTVGTSPSPFTAATTPVPGETVTADNTAPPMTPTTPVVAAPAPNVSVSIGQPLTPFVAGSPSNVPVTLTNSGTAPDAGAITSTITLPAGFTTTTGTFSPAVGTTCSTSGQIVTCTTAGPLSNVSPNNTTTFNLPITPAASTVGTTPTTTASVSSPNEPVANQGNNGPVSMTPTTPVTAAPAPNVSVNVGQPLTPFVAGSPSNVPVTLTNSGTAPDAGAITSTITLPAGFTTTTGTFSPAVGTTCSTSGQIVTCTTAGPLSNVSPNNTTTFNLPITPAASTVGTTPTTTASVSSPNEPVANQGNNGPVSMTPTTPVSAAPAPNVSVSVGQPLTPFVAGSPSNVPVTLTNSGTAPDAGAITSTITLPAGFTTTTGTFSPAVGTTCSTSGQIVTCTTAGPLSNVSPNNTTTFNLPITPAASTVGTTPTTTASVSSPNEPVANQGNNGPVSMTPTIPVSAGAAPDLTSAMGQPVGTFAVGVLSNIPVTISNIGTAATTGITTTTITLPFGMTTTPTFTSNGWNCNTSSSVVTCTNSTALTTTGATAASTFNVPVTPNAAIVGTTPTFNTTVANAGEPTTKLANNPSTMVPTTPIAAAPSPDLVTTIGQPLTPFVAGIPSIIPVTVTNIGTSPTTGIITTTITLPTGTSAPVTFTSNGNNCNTVGQTVTCTNQGPISNVAPNNTAVINVPVTPAASTVGTSPTPFTASPTTPGETVTGNNAATPMTPTTPVAASPAPDLVTTIGQPLTPFVAGTPSIVPVTVTNIGSAPTTGIITTTITLPTGTSAPATFTSNGNNCMTSGQTVTCTNPGPISNVAPNNNTVINVPVTPAASTVGTTPTPFTASPTTPGETVTGNNAATPMTPTMPVAAAPVVNVKVNVKLFLQGAYETSTGMMRDDLRSKGYLPTSQPYSAMARTSYHTGTETTTFAVFSATGTNAIVDWVLLELRTGTGAATRVATRAALVQRDGDVVDVDGVSPVTFTNRAAASYYIVATHRNHLGVMSEIPVALSATATTCDFTGAYDGFGNYAMKGISNINALWAGNSNHTGITHKSLIFSGGNNDPDAVKNNVLTTAGNAALDFSFVPMGYHIGDTNLDGDVKYQGPTNDVDNMIFFNVMTHPANATVTPLHIVSENH